MTAAKSCPHGPGCASRAGGVAVRQAKASAQRTRLRPFRAHAGDSAAHIIQQHAQARPQQLLLQRSATLPGGTPGGLSTRASCHALQHLHHHRRRGCPAPASVGVRRRNADGPASAPPRQRCCPLSPEAGEGRPKGGMPGDAHTASGTSLAPWVHVRRAPPLPLSPAPAHPPPHRCLHRTRRLVRLIIIGHARSAQLSVLRRACSRFLRRLSRRRSPPPCLRISLRA